MFEVLLYINTGLKSHLLVPSYQRNDDLAVRVCLEVVRLLERLAEDAVVVNFAVDC